MLFRIIVSLLTFSIAFSFIKMILVDRTFQLIEKSLMIILIKI